MLMRRWGPRKSEAITTMSDSMARNAINTPPGCQTTWLSGGERKSSKPKCPLVSSNRCSRCSRHLEADPYFSSRRLFGVSDCIAPGSGLAGFWRSEHSVLDLCVCGCPGVSNADTAKKRTTRLGSPAATEFMHDR